MMFFIMLPCYLIVAGAFIYSMNYIAKPNGNLLLGVKIPKDQMENPEVLTMVARYKKEEKLLNLIMFGLLLVGFFVRDYGIISTIYSFVWIFLYLGGMQLLFFRSYDWMYTYKKKQGWIVGEQYKVSYAYQRKDLLMKKVYPFWHWGIVFVLTVIGCFLWRPIRFENDQLGYVMMSVIAGCFLLLWVTSLVISRSNIKIMNHASEEKISFYQFQRYELTKVMTLSGYSNALGWIFGSLFVSREENGMMIVIVSIAITILVCGILFYGIYTINERRRQLNEIEAANEDDVVDDDAYWRGGLYSNPHDPKLWVEKRNGIGLQVNSAKPAAKIFNIATTLLILALFLWLVTLIPLDFPSLSIHITEDTLYVEATQYNTEIKIEDIDEAILIDELPKMYRNEGYSDKNYDFGKFRMIGYGQSKVYINETVRPYLVLYVDDKIYFVNSDEEEEVQNVIIYLIQCGKLTTTE